MHHSMRLSVLVLYLFAASWSILNAKEYERATMSVQGHAIVRKPADELQLTLGVISQAKTAGEALNINNQKTSLVLQKLQQLGLKSSEYQTSQFMIRPLYTVPPKNPPADWTAAINGYEATNQVTIQTDQIALAGPIIDNTSQVGANVVSNLSFCLKNQHDYYAEAIAMATQYALEDAQQLAQAAHVQLLRILDIALEQAQPAPMLLHALKATNMASSENAIAAGDIDVAAHVTITYEIR